MQWMLIALLGCAGGVVDTYQDTATSCEVTIDETYPIHGTEDAYYRGAIEFHLSEPDPTALVVADFTGIQTTRGDGSVIVYTPSVPLDPSTSYTVGLEYCRGAPEISFTTSALGTELADPSILEGKAYSFDLLDARFQAGREVAETAATFFDRNLLASVSSVDGDWLHIRLGKALEDTADTQDFCARTVDLPSANFRNMPWFHIQTDELEFGAYAADLSLLQLQLSGTFAADASYLGGLVMSAVVDARDISELITGQTPDSLCEIMGNLYIPCEPCPSDGYSYCFDLSFENLNGESVDMQLESIEEPNTDSRCGNQR